ncbi:hydantoinase B/oxoprolinase family protein [Acuticoccus sp. MNP-M23]|uniref:hydantoinase B/oxoprolinase family protein n=1 Tax=Acuticoccus sp. MNP-M23 TaxID=3072793 RepID=UPI00281539C9|nr:hydantoinase B/oxoprolinase family protein [Acuticoccus sp. MNP-M23]WMS43509.1 hydantoinase B/oxoprolinase family protein [Acuticoccus sp. MNP-M23]
MALDQLKLEVLWNRLIATVNEQAAALMRTSFTSIVREAGDLSAGVFDRRGRMVAQAVTGTPGHINAMATCMHHLLGAYPVDTLNEGDVLITNDPWMTAGQLNDITIVTPVFKNGRCVGFFGNCCHALDIGGRGLSADSREIFEEGLQIPILKLYDAGKPNETLYALLKANVRTPEEVMGDLHSQVVGNEVGARQLLAFMADFGLDDIEEVADAIVERSEAAMRDRIAALPDGTYGFEMMTDGFDTPIKLVCTVTIAGTELTVDYEGTSDAVDRGINVALNYSAAYTTYGIKCAISPDIPNNEGSFRPVKVTAPLGSILNCQHPSPVAGRHLVGHFLPSLVFGALEEILPEKVMAASFDALWDSQVYGDRPEGGRFAYVWFAAGGVGAIHGRDGMSATAFPSAIAGIQSEMIEALVPIFIAKRELVADSGGAGRWRGGLAQSFTLGVRGGKPFTFSGLYDRMHHAAAGLAGGQPGAVGKITTRSGDPLRAKTRNTLPGDEEVTLELPGGGGYGNPHERPADSVRADVEAGYVSAERARSDYGVAIDPKSLAIDEAETARLRAAMAAA